MADTPTGLGGSNAVIRGGLALKNNIRVLTGTTAPTNGTSGTGVGKAGPGSLYLRTNGTTYVNVGTKASPNWLAQVQFSDVTISAADIVATAAGKFGHANGYPLVAAPGAGFAVEFVGALLVYDYDTAAYTAGGNITVNATGGSALTGIISAANSVGAAADKIVQFVPLATAAVNVAANTGLSLVAAAAFTQPGTAAGVIRVRTAYRIHATLL